MLKRNIITHAAIAAFAMAGAANAACPSTNPNHSSNVGYLAAGKVIYDSANNQIRLTGSGNASNLEDALNLATRTGKQLVIETNSNNNKFHTISKTIKINIKRTLKVSTTDKVTFKGSSSLDGDLIALKGTSSTSECNTTGSTGNTIKPGVVWRGGRFIMADAKVSTVVPGGQSANLSPASQKGTSATADGLSIRGEVDDPNSSNANDRILVLGHIDVQNIKFYGTSPGSTQNYRYAGGDSGILMVGASRATFKNNRFYGVRDAGIYVSADNYKGHLGDNYTMENNYVERAYDGLTSKRGADKITFKNNDLNDVVVGISTKNRNSGSAWTASDITVTGNEITKTVRGISLERANDVTISNNKIKDVGATVGGNSRPSSNSFDKTFYEAISLNGVTNINSIDGNEIRGVNPANSADKVYALVYRKHDGQSTDNTRPTFTVFSANNPAISGVDGYVKLGSAGN
ncbi:right-handed parallel beta-helix repeat-containing protein [Catenovulum agarivorans]|uniref:right-handed parallel beta-helix repeat-containing protein n=1 Tax=Catenovulum agarivorans TaxID=1172192 RepID=UPI000304B5D3|nr:right-handed parallel beta-helix repeat-containing protein [Catenovulum agarivorans]